MFDEPNVAVVKVVVCGDWAVAIACSEQAQKRLGEEIERAIPVIMRGIHNWQGYDAQYQVTVEMIGDEQNQ